MKIPAELVEEMRAAIAPLDTAERRQAYRDGNFPRAEFVRDLDKRYRWDLFYAAGGGFHFKLNEFEANMTHIDTALRKIVAPL